MRYLSLFSGVEAATLAWKPLGWEAVAFAEVNLFASAVLAHRFPETPNLGDVTRIGEAELEKLGRIDVMIFGSPCTDFSVAGKREGMENADGERTRSGLFYEAIRIVRLAARINGCRWFIMENVPGMLSCRGGRDFAAILREISGCTFPVPIDGWRNGGVVRGEDGGWSLAWRTLDARFFGVPQRRRRVFLVGSLGHWTDPASLLFIGESLSRNPPTRGKTRPHLARSVKSSSPGGGYSSSDGQGTLIPETAFAVQTQDRRAAQGWNTTLVGTIPSGGTPNGHGRSGLSNQGVHAGHVVVSPIPIQNATRGKDQNGMGIGNENSPMFTIDSTGVHAVAYQCQETVVPIAFDCRASGSRDFAIGDDAGTLRGEGSGGGHAAIAYQCQGNNVGPMGTVRSGNGNTAGGVPFVAAKSVGVRRLTPIETERLQGMPEDHTRIPYRGKAAELCPDGNRYQAIGNSFAVPVIRWLGERLERMENP